MISHSSIGLAMLTIALTPDLETDLRRLSQEDVGETVEGLVCRLIRDAAAEARLGKPNVRELLTMAVEDTGCLRAEVRASLDEMRGALAPAPGFVVELRPKTALADDAPAPEETPTSSTPPTPSEPPASSQVPDPPPVPTPAASAKRTRKPLSDEHKAAISRARRKSTEERPASKETQTTPAPVVAPAPTAPPTPKSPAPAGRRATAEALKQAALDRASAPTTPRELLERLKLQNIRRENFRSQDRSALLQCERHGWLVMHNGFACLTRGGDAEIGGKRPKPDAFLELVLDAPKLPTPPAGVPSLFGGAG